MIDIAYQSQCHSTRRTLDWTEIAHAHGSHSLAGCVLHRRVHYSRASANNLYNRHSYINKAGKIWLRLPASMMPTVFLAVGPYRHRLSLSGTSIDLFQLIDFHRSGELIAICKTVEFKFY